ncbi:hypothetical protein R4172_09345 [Rhodococcus kroppenstedtii]|uniref:hypothetical protein n=1 Tax=Rhodococcoides kroppenstedtii TaxID=293050 RepID=UPI002952E8D4|nr:hypothetical protein [Rhodococcus kroppenstedtii]MDV7197767.1 hypothetical protein [Rhodococcus kroppenstedtii]
MDWLPWLQLLATLVGPALAASVVIWGWNRTHNDALSRDLADWRRTKLADTTDQLTEAARTALDNSTTALDTIDRLTRTLIHLSISKDFARRLTLLRVDVSRLLDTKKDLEGSGSFDEHGKLDDEIEQSIAAQKELIDVALEMILVKLLAELKLSDPHPAPSWWKCNPIYRYYDGITDPEKPWKSNPFRKHRRTHR